MEVDRVLLRNTPDNVGIVDVAITSPKSAGRNLDVLSGHNYLILVLLPRVVLRVPYLLFLPLPRLYCHRKSMIDSDSKSSLRTIFQRLMHLLQVCTLILPLLKSPRY